MAEFQAVVLCGGTGSRMKDICNENPRYLLELANVPLFWFPVNSLVTAGVKDIKLLFRSDLKNEVEHLLKAPLFKFATHYMEVIFFDEVDDGTADTLRHFANKITKDKDIILCSGDFISDASLLPVIDRFRAEQADLLCLLSDNAVTGPVPGPKRKGSKGRDLIAFVEESRRLVFMLSEDDFEIAIDALPWLSKFPNVSLSDQIVDCHVYFLRQHLLQNMLRDSSISSLKADFIPRSLASQLKEENELKCVGCILPHENGTVNARVNTVGSYFEISKAFIKSLNYFSPNLPIGKSFEFKKTGICCVDSWVDVNAEVHDGVVIKRSSVNKKVLLGSKSRVENSLVMDGAKIGRGCWISHSIICPFSTVEENSEVVNCIVGNNCRIIAGTKIKDEILKEDEDDVGGWVESD